MIIVRRKKDVVLTQKIVSINKDGLKYKAELSETGIIDENKVQLYKLRLYFEGYPVFINARFGINSVDYSCGDIFTNEEAEKIKGALIK